MGIITTKGSADLNTIYLNNQPQNVSLWLGLFTNDLPTGSMNTVEFTDITEPTVVDYARIELLPTTWIVYGDVSIYPQQEFEVALASYGTIYGCFIATSMGTAGKIIAIHKFTTPVDLTFYGDRVRIIPKITIT